MGNGKEWIDNILSMIADKIMENIPGINIDTARTASKRQELSNNLEELRDDIIKEEDILDADELILRYEPDIYNLKGIIGELLSIRVLDEDTSQNLLSRIDDINAIISEEGFKVENWKRKMALLINGLQSRVGRFLKNKKLEENTSTW